MFSCHAIYLIFCISIWSDIRSKKEGIVSLAGDTEQIQSRRGSGGAWVAGLGISEKQLTEKAHILVQSFTD